MLSHKDSARHDRIQHNYDDVKIGWRHMTSQMHYYWLSVVFLYKGPVMRTFDAFFGQHDEQTIELTMIWHFMTLMRCHFRASVPCPTGTAIVNNKATPLKINVPDTM